MRERPDRFNRFRSGRVMTQAAPVPTEAAIQKQILEYLEIRGIFHFRNNTGAFPSEYKGKKRFIRFGSVGSSDILGIYPGGRFLAIEVKRPGGKLSDHQKHFLEQVQARNGIGIVAHSVDDVMKVLEGGMA